MRADARENRERLLEAADDLIARKGVSVSVSEIVAAAGVGPPTLYRHFGTKDGLIKAIGARRYELVAAQLARALAQPSGWEGLETALGDYLEMASKNRAIREQRGVAIPRELERILLAGWETLVERGHAEGSVRKDFAPTDVPFLVSAIATAGRVARYDRALQERYVALFMEGLRPGARAPLPGAPPSPDQIREFFAPEQGANQRGDGEASNGP